MNNSILNERETKNIFPIIILSVFSILWLWFYTSAIDKTDWWIENILVIIFLVYLFITRKKIQTATHTG